MSLVASVVASVLLGVIGGSVGTTVLLYSDVAINVTVQNSTVELPAQTVVAVPVQLPVTDRQATHTILVESDDVSYALPVTVEGKRDWSWLWYLAPAPILIAALVWLFSRRGAGSS